MSQILQAMPSDVLPNNNLRALALGGRSTTGSNSQSTKLRLVKSDEVPRVCSGKTMYSYANFNNVHTGTLSDWNRCMAANLSSVCSVLNTSTLFKSGSSLK